jgi:protein-S-isoprenylcysteine O-methyltransferase Ste14
MLFFTPLALGSLLGLVFFLPMFVVIVVRLLEEEKFLRKNLPGYEEYCQMVRHHLVPFVW